MPAQDVLIPMHAFEFFDRLAERPAVRLIKKDSGLPFLYRFDGTAPAISDHRTPGSVCFEGRHAKVFLAGKQQRSTTRSVVIDDGVRLASQEFDAVVGEFFQPRSIGSVANYHQPPVHAFAGFDSQVDSLIRHQTRKHQIVIVNFVGHVKAVDVDWRRNDMSFAAVDLSDPGSDEARVSYVIVGLLRSAQVPFAQAPHEQRQSAADDLAEALARYVIVITPDPAHRRMTIANVNRVAPAPHAFRVPGTAAED